MVRMKLRDFCIPQKKSNLKASEGLNIGKYKFFTSSNIQNKFINMQIFDQPALIIGTGGSASIHYCDQPFAVSTDCLVFYGNGKVDLKMVYLFLSSHMYLIESGFKGAGLRHISKQYILDISINLPDLEIQKSIVEKLDNIHNLILLRNKQLENVDLLSESQFIKMFGDSLNNSMNWRVVSLKELFKIRSSKRIYQAELKSKGIQFFRLNDLVRKIDKRETSCDIFISEEQYNQLFQNGFVPKVEDILVTSRGTLGKCYIMQNDDKFYFQDGMISWLEKTDIEIESLYIKYLFESKSFKKQIAAASKGAVIDFISLIKLGNLHIMLPDITIQKEFADLVEQNVKFKNQLQLGLEKLDKLYKSVMYKYFV